MTHPAEDPPEREAHGRVPGEPVNDDADGAQLGLPAPRRVRLVCPERLAFPARLDRDVPDQALRLAARDFAPLGCGDHSLMRLGQSGGNYIRRHACPRRQLPEPEVAQLLCPQGLRWHLGRLGEVELALDSDHAPGLAGWPACPYLGYALRIVGSDTVDGWRVVRLNVRTGRKEEFAPAVPGGAGQYPFHDGVLKVLVTPRGSLAWISLGEITDPTHYKVVALSAGASTPRLIASETTIEPESLAVSPGYLYWSQAGAPHSAPLP